MDLKISEALPFAHTHAVTAIEGGTEQQSQQHYVVTGSEDSTIKMWLLVDNQFKLHGSFEGHVRSIHCLRLIKDPASGMCPYNV